MDGGGFGLNTVTLCLSSFEGPQELTPRESKESERKKKKKIGLTKLDLVTTAATVEMLLKIGGLFMWLHIQTEISIQWIEKALTI